MGGIVYVDSRTGSKHLARPLQQLLGNAFKVKVCEMEFGDIVFSGEGPFGPVTIRVELKTISDLLDSLATRRIIEHQLVGLMDANETDVGWLLIQGSWRPHLTLRKGGHGFDVVMTKDHGKLEIFAGMAGKRGWLRSKWRMSGWSYEAVNEILLGMRSKYNVNIWRTVTLEETLCWLVSQIKWWDKPWDEHKSAEAWAGQDCFGQVAHIRRPSMIEKVAANITGIGQKRALLVARRFKTVRNIVNSDPEDWVGIRSPGPSKSGGKKPQITLSQAQLICAAFDEEHVERRR